MTRPLVLGLIVLAIAVAGAVFLAGPIVRHFKGEAAKAQVRTETQTDQTVSTEQELAAERDLTRQSLDLTVTVRAAERRAAQLEQDVRADPDAEEPLPVPSVDRLRGHDDWLCGQRVALCPDRRPAPG